MSDAETLRVYDARAQDYARMVAKEALGAALSRFLDGLPMGARLLDLGCGPGNAAAAMARAGYRVDALDASAEMVRIAAGHPGVTAWQATFDSLDSVAHYAGIWANFSLLHASREAMPGHLEAIRRALLPGGRLHIGLKAGTGERRDSLGRFYTYYTEPELDALLRQAGLTPGAFRHGTDIGLDGESAAWITTLAHA
ncbi:MAG: class I SAM-dependent methyltransferase [Roseivivax sp.]|nr:class I SAM-dependent methyltransferase [Roseivivax sp.]